MSDKKPRLGISLAALMAMLSGASGISSGMTPHAVIDIFTPPWGVAVYGLGLTLSLAEVVLAMAILRLREWARVALIGAMLANIAVVLFSPFFYNPQYLQTQSAALRREMDKMQFMQDKRITQMKNSFEERIKSYSPDDKERMRRMFNESLISLPNSILRISLFLLGLGGFLWYTAIIFLLTRPRSILQFE